MSVKPEYTGIWRITGMSMWDQDFIDLIAPGCLEIKTYGTGKISFGAVEADIVCDIEKYGDQEKLLFTFTGWDEGDEVTGNGWAVIEGNRMEGWFCFHLGDESTFEAERT